MYSKYRKHAKTTNAINKNRKFNYYLIPAAWTFKLKSSTTSKYCFLWKGDLVPLTFTWTDLKISKDSGSQPRYYHCI